MHSSGVGGESVDDMLFFFITPAMYLCHLCLLVYAANAKHSTLPFLLRSFLKQDVLTSFVIFTILSNMSKEEKKNERSHEATIKKWEASILKEKQKKAIEINNVFVGEQMSEYFWKFP